jgi:hypothetical protein
VIAALRGRVGRYVVASTVSVSVYGEGGHALGRHTVTEPLIDEERFAVDYRTLEPVRETDLVNWLGVMAAAAGKPLNAVSVPSEILQRYTQLPWKQWSYAPFSSSPLLMNLDKAQADIGLDYRVSLAQWMATTVAAHLESESPDPEQIEQRALEVEFAGRWQPAAADLGRALGV